MDHADVSSTAEELEMMGQALDQAEAALAAAEVPVGCVFVHPTQGVIGRGHNETVITCNATRHAELVAIDQMLLRDSRPPSEVAACTLFVTVEPCIMCASALRQIGVRRVVFGCGNDKFGGCGSVLSLHDRATAAAPGTMAVRRGVRAEEAVALLRRFYAQENQGAPLPQKRTRKQLELAGVLEQGAVGVGCPDERRHAESY